MMGKGRWEISSKDTKTTVCGTEVARNAVYNAKFGHSAHFRLHAAETN
jgi:hypothetical protein